MFRHYFLPPFDELNFFCFPHSVGKYTRPDKHYVLREEGVKDFSLHFIVGGKGYLEIDNTVYALKQGDVFLHVPYQKMSYHMSNDESWDIYWMQFNGNKLTDFLLERGFHESSLWFMNESELLERSFLDLIEEVEQFNISRPTKLSALTYAVLIEFISNAIPFANRKGKGNIEKVIQLLPLMRKDAHLPYDLERWASEAGLTPNYFCSLFKKITKMTPLSYITKCRIQISKHLLLSDPSMPINKISIASGYPNPSYFNKIFMELEGITPSEFRKNHSQLQAL
ncbi:helix-turn-helix domain-containing protein [Cohnella sp. CFH 77786]|nr:helix-turn-helix domain-containing protein [Cohnella sp. CFH 77786]